MLQPVDAKTINANLSVPALPLACPDPVLLFQTLSCKYKHCASATWRKNLEKFLRKTEFL